MERVRILQHVSLGKKETAFSIIMSVLFHWERRKLLSSPYSYVYSLSLGKMETTIFTI